MTEGSDFDTEDQHMPIRILKLQIRFIVEPDGERFHAYCPDLKGIHVDGDTEQDALENGRLAVEAYMCSLMKHEDPIPVGVKDNQANEWDQVRPPTRFSAPSPVGVCRIDWAHNL
jgi:predicted RNase H-like HicB family nuclease